ncbi:hypothetical protein [Rhodococcus sp. 1139]|uniref:hypothetical protein n=1 Tax=Rhodococcus sp. 1139 TaxID=1833762 RepID=UPI000871F558|nr:hypothetical protein [Rhodococcus sp. 1139]OFE08242.1 hypothetical protein A5N83_13820 [Rhodococcus sp. 1139]
MKQEESASQKPPSDVRISGVKRDRSAASLRKIARACIALAGYVPDLPPQDSTLPAAQPKNDDEKGKDRE